MSLRNITALNSGLFFYLFFSTLLFLSCDRKQQGTASFPKSENIIPRRLDITIQSKPITRNELPVLWDAPFHPVDITKYHLLIDGLVSNERKFGLGDLEMLPSRQISARIKSVDGWSIRRAWTGVHFSEICKIVRPKPEAKYVWFFCADNNFECVELTDLKSPKTILAFYLEDNFIPLENGGPVMLIMPHKYSYKWAKEIVKITFSAEKKPGTATERNPQKYPFDGDIKAGKDFPLDLDGERIIAGGEITEY